MSRSVTGVLICCFIVALLLLRHCDLSSCYRRHLPFFMVISLTSSCYPDIKDYLFLCIKVLVLPRLRSPLPQANMAIFCLIYHRIHCATSPVIALTRLLKFLFLMPLLLPFSPNLAIHPMPRLTTLSRVAILFQGN
jgi:hypothetical protein